MSVSVSEWRHPTKNKNSTLRMWRKNRYSRNRAMVVRVSKTKAQLRKGRGNFGKTKVARDPRTRPSDPVCGLRL